VSEPTFTALGVAVVTVSDTRDRQTDTSGALLVQLLTTAGHSIVERHLVRDELLLLRDLFARLRDAAGVEIVIATGGTGLTARDVTPEALEPLVTKPIVGFGELFRSLSYAEIGTSTIQSRAMGALCGQTLFFLLPGSRPAVRLAMEQILLPQLDRRTRPCNFAELLPRF
jgi:molybdenum cofactor biosynthesis protein B